MKHAEVEKVLGDVPVFNACAESAQRLAGHASPMKIKRGAIWKRGTKPAPGTDGMFIVTSGCLLVSRRFNHAKSVVHLRRVFPLYPFGLSYCLTEKLTADVSCDREVTAIFIPRTEVVSAFHDDRKFREETVRFLIDLQDRMTEELVSLTADASDRLSAVLGRLTQQANSDSRCHACGADVASQGRAFACATNEELARFTGLSERSMSRHITALRTFKKPAVRLADKRHVAV